MHFSLEKKNPKTKCRHPAFTGPWRKNLKRFTQTYPATIRLDKNRY